MCSLIASAHNRLSREAAAPSPIVIAASPRGGSTWVAEILANSMQNPATIWEPLHPNKMKSPYPDFTWREFIPEEVNWPEAYWFFKRLFSSEIMRAGDIELWSYHGLWKWHQRAKLIKFVRANRLLPWLATNFPEIHPILVVRHPCAVISSQLNHPAFERNLPRCNSIGGEFSSYYNQFVDILDNIATIEEALTTTWCLDHIIPLRHRFNNRRWTTVYYEELVQYPEREVKRILKGIESSPQTVVIIIQKGARCCA